MINDAFEIKDAMNRILPYYVVLIFSFKVAYAEFIFFLQVKLDFKYMLVTY